MPDSAHLLKKLGADVHLAHPLGNNWGARKVKNDERDAKDLAATLRLGRLVEGWIASPETRELREVVRYSFRLVGLHTSCKAQVHGVMAKNATVTGQVAFSPPLRVKGTSNNGDIKFTLRLFHIAVGQAKAPRQDTAFRGPTSPVDR